MRPTYDRLDGEDGFASLEVSPRLAHDTDATIAEARRLWTAVDRPNVMIKVPATREGLPAIRQLTAERALEASSTRSNPVTLTAHNLATAIEQAW